MSKSLALAALLLAISLLTDTIAYGGFCGAVFGDAPASTVEDGRIILERMGAVIDSRFDEVIEGIVTEPLTPVQRDWFKRKIMLNIIDEAIEQGGRDLDQLEHAPWLVRRLIALSTYSSRVRSRFSQRYALSLARTFTKESWSRVRYYMPQDLSRPDEATSEIDSGGETNP